MSQDNAADMALADLHTLADRLSSAPTATVYPTHIFIHNRATAEALGIKWDDVPDEGNQGAHGSS